MTRAFLRRLFGPGTILALAFLAVYFVAGKKEHVQPAVASGNLVATPLWKPEPAFLITNAKEIKISDAQLKQIRVLDQAWKEEKKRLLKDLEQFQQRVPSEGVTGPALASSFEGYSELSRAFDASRRSFWSVAENVLTAEQRSRVGLIKEARK